MEVKAVIFDMDGLLVETEIVSFNIYNAMLKEFNKEMTLKQYTEYYSGKTEVTNVTRLIEEYQLPWSLQQGIDEVNKHEDILLRQGVPLKKGASTLLNYLKKHHIKIALATSSTKPRANFLFVQHEEFSYFNNMTFGNEVEKGKPNPDIFLKAFEKLDVLKEECLILEDSEAGVEAGYRSNIPVICIPDLKMPSKQTLEKATKVYQSLDQVIEYIENKKSL